MLTTRYWTRAARGDGVSPFGDATNVLGDRRRAERVFRSVATWCGLNELAFRVGVCGDPRERAGALESSLVELTRVADGDLMHVTYVKKPWTYMHVVLRTADAALAERTRGQLIDIGRSLGRCENNDRDLVDPVRRPPYFVYVLTGKLPPRNQLAAPAEKAAAPSLVGLADL